MLGVTLLVVAFLNFPKENYLFDIAFVATLLGFY